MPLKCLSIGSWSAAAAEAAAESRSPARPATGASPRSTRSRSVTTSSCSGTSNEAKWAGSSIGRTPSAARAASMSDSAELMQPTLSGAPPQTSNVAWLGEILVAGSDLAANARKPTSRLELRTTSRAWPVKTCANADGLAASASASASASAASVRLDPSSAQLRSNRRAATSLSHLPHDRRACVVLGWARHISAVNVSKFGALRWKWTDFRPRTARAASAWRRD